MKERDYAVYCEKRKTNIYNHDTLFNLACCVDRFEGVHSKENNIPNGYFLPMLDKLTEEEIVVYFAYLTDGRFEKFGQEIDGPPRMVKSGPITVDIATDFFDKIGIQYFKDGDENDYKKHPFDLEAYKKTMYYMPTKYLKEEHKHLSKYYGEETNHTKKIKG